MEIEIRVLRFADRELAAQNAKMPTSSVRSMRCGFNTSNDYSRRAGRIQSTTFATIRS
jgi:hypothetical protein